MESPGSVRFLTMRAGLILMILLFLALLMVFYPTSKSGKMQTRSSVKGIVYDTAGMPVENATVMIIDGADDFEDIASISNEKGEFFIKHSHSRHLYNTDPGKQYG